MDERHGPRRTLQSVRRGGRPLGPEPCCHMRPCWHASTSSNCRPRALSKIQQRRSAILGTRWASLPGPSSRGRSCGHRYSNLSTPQPLVGSLPRSEPASWKLGCRKPAWRRSGRVVSGQRGAWISSSPDSADASRGRLLCRKATALRAGSDLRWYCATTPNQTAPSKWFSIAFAVSRRFLRPFITIIGANSLKIPLGITSSS